MKWSVAIHQPDFMPWIGFFNKISKVNEFVILDHVTNNVKDSAFWGRRVKILSNGKPDWLSIPLRKNKGETFIPITKMQINIESENMPRSLQLIQNNYQKYPHFSQVYYLVKEYFHHHSDYLSIRNTDFILEVLNRLQIDVKISYSSELNPKFKSNEMLIDILKKCNATHYRCGMGAKDYQNDELFIDNNITIEYNDYSPKPYYQFNSNEFIPGLSVIDVLMNLGFEETSSFLKQDKI